jgi:hypothetical protein
MFRLGTLLRGATRVPNVKTNTWLGLVSTATGFERAYVKILPPAQFISESLCAWLLLQVGLPTPEPLWVMVHASVLPGSRAGRRVDEKQICFGTLALAAQSLWRGSVRDPEAVRQLTRWEHTLPGGIFDELVANDDRGPENILTDGRGGYWLIDHNHAFGSDKWTAEWLIDNAFPDFSNKLLELLAATSASQRMKFDAAARGHCARFVKALKDLPLSDLAASARTKQAVDGFLSARAQRLVEMTRSRLGLDELPLTRPLN